jgi:hypothetical protein
MIDASPQTVRAVADALQLASLLDDRFGHTDDARVAAWSEQVQHHNLQRADLLDAVQAFYDQPQQQSLGVGDLIHHARAVKRTRLEKESDADREERRAMADFKAADDAAELAGIAQAFVPGPVAQTLRLDRAELALQTCRGKQESIAAIREFFAAKAAAPKLTAA